MNYDDKDLWLNLCAALMAHIDLLSIVNLVKVLNLIANLSENQKRFAELSIDKLYETATEKLIAMVNT